jgi:glycosyltransferase involved in cell wall biosynthesis
MKVIIQIPCYNEENTLPITLAELPRKLPGIDVVEWLVVNDGSTDRTVKVARDHGVDHVVSLSRNRGLARAFSAGLEACLIRGADIIVNTDADNQYCAADIPKLIGPILEGKAEIVIGERPIRTIKHFSPTKKLLQRFGSVIVRIASGVDVPDAPSGFRAMTREAALRLDVFSRYSYTLETIIQAGQSGIPVASVPIRVNGPLRASRLVRSIPDYLMRSGQTIVRIFALYRPFRFFAALGAVPFGVGLVLSIRWLWLYFFEFPITGRTHIPSLIAAAVLLGFAMQIFVLAFVADLLRANRMLVKEGTYLIRKREFAAASTGSTAADRYEGKELDAVGHGE